jgi:hypothetical protein
MVLLGLYVLIILEVSSIKYSFWDAKTCSERRIEQQIKMYGPIALKFVLQIVHRTLAAMMASTMSVAILAAMNEVTISCILRNFCALI